MPGHYAPRRGSYPNRSWASIMSRSLYVDLGWLPPAPADVRAQIRALAAQAADVPAAGAMLMALAGHALGDIRLAGLGAAATALSVSGADLAPLTRFRLGVVGTGTLDLLIPALTGAALRHGVLLDCIVGDYGQIMQDALDPGSSINRAGCDAVLLAIDYRSLPIPTALAERGAAVAASLAFIDLLRKEFRRNCGAPCIVQTFVPPPERLFGSFDRRVASSLRAILDAVNAALCAESNDNGDMLLDVAALAETVGTAEWHSPEQWNLAKLPFAASCTPLYADHLGRLLGAIRGKARRCLILDLDNTLWGGVIGDDGMQGIRLAEGDAVGEAFRDVQRTALMLRDRGIVLAVSSKNTDAVARAVFREHPEMLLREQDIAIFQANWEDKASNIRAIANGLSLGLSSMVFLDDNPAERELVRRLLPEVAVPELPDDPALYARTLLAAGYFEAVAFSDEDRKRAGFYQSQAERVALAGKSDGLDSYIASLSMELSLAPFDASGRQRIAQLVNKSNQFNLTTHRYSEPDIAALERNPDVYTLQARLTDMFGDNGMICVVIAKVDGADRSDWTIDTWLMSCRVLGRRVEEAVLRDLVFAARARDIHRLVGLYRPTGRNALVRDHYAKLGFEEAGNDLDGTTRWTLDTRRELPGMPPMKIRHMSRHG